MKKIFLIASLGMLMLSSFTTLEKENKNTLMSLKKSTTLAHTYYFTCTNGNSGSFSCDCDLAGAWKVANRLCSFSLN